MSTETKDLGMEIHPGEGVVDEKFPHNRKPSHKCVSGELGNLRGQKNWGGKNPQSTGLIAITSGKGAQMPTSTSSECGLGREA